MWGNAFLLAVRQIRRNPMRSLLTVLGIVIGVAAVITMVTIGNGATQAVRQEIESFGSNQLMLRPGQRMGPGGSAGAPSFKVADVEAIESQIAGVIAVAPQVPNPRRSLRRGKTGRRASSERRTITLRSTIATWRRGVSLKKPKKKQGRPCA